MMFDDVCTRSRRRGWGVVRGLATLALAACSADQATGLAVDARNQTVAIEVGQEVAITLGNIGPALYVAPPQLSSSALAYLDVSVVPPYTPGGPTQRFRFRAAARGVAIVTFRRMLNDALVSTVEDTIEVR